MTTHNHNVPPADGPLVSVAVCTYGRPDLLAVALSSLARQTAPRQDFEVLVVDNEPSERTRAVAAGFSPDLDLRYIVQPKTGLSHARNAAWRRARGWYVAYLDDDAKAAPDWVQHICRILRSDDPPDVFGGKILPFHHGECPDWVDEDVFSVTCDLHDLGDDPCRRDEPPFLWGSNIAIRRDLLEGLGGFSPKLGMSGKGAYYGEESDFQFRVFQEGGSIWYFPELVVYHLSRPEKRRIASLIKLQWAHGASHVSVMAHQGARFGATEGFRQAFRGARRFVRGLIEWPLRDRRRYPRPEPYCMDTVVPAAGMMSTGLTKLRISLGRAFRFASDDEGDAWRAETRHRPSFRMSPRFEEGLVSVIMPAYNREWIIEETLECVRRQTYRPIELVVVDDGSTDGTARAVERFAESAGDDLNVRCLRKENEGANTARNYGLERCRGEFIQFLDSDDVIMPDKIERQVELMRREPEVQYVFSAFKILRHESGEVDEGLAAEFSGDRDELLDGMIEMANLPLWTVNGLYRRGLCRRIGPWETRWQIHDRLYNTRLLLTNVPLRYVPEVHALMRRHERERWTAHTWEPERMMSHRRGWLELVKLLRLSGELNRRRRRILMSSFAHLARGMLEAGHRDVARRLLLDGLRVAPRGRRTPLAAALLTFNVPGKAEGVRAVRPRRLSATGARLGRLLRSAARVYRRRGVKAIFAKTFGRIRRALGGGT